MRIRNRGLTIVVSQGLTQASTVALAMVLVRLVPKETFGSFQQVFMIYVFLSGVFSLQLDASLYYFIPKLGSEFQRQVTVQTLVLTTALAVVVSGVMYLGAGPIARTVGNPALAPLIRIFALYPFAERILFIIPAFMISTDRAFRAGQYTVAAALSRLALVAVLTALGFDLWVVFAAIVALACVIASIGCADILRLSQGPRFGLDVSLLREQIEFCIPLIATAVVGTVSLQLDKIIIATSFSPGMYAIYSCGALDLPIVGLLTTSLSSAIMPDLVRSFNKGKRHEGLHIWQEAARKSSLIIFPCFVFFFLAGQDVMVLLYGKQYSLASLPFRVYLLALPLKIAVYAAMFRALGKTKPIAVGALIALSLNAAIGYSLVKAGGQSTLGFVGPAVGAVAATFGAVSYAVWRLARTMSLPYSKIMRWKELAFFLGLSIVCGLVVFAIPLSMLPLTVRLAIQGSAFALLFLLVAVLSKRLKPDEKELLAFPLRLARGKLS